MARDCIFSHVSYHREKKMIEILSRKQVLRFLLLCLMSLFLPEVRWTPVHDNTRAGHSHLLLCKYLLLGIGFSLLAPTYPPVSRKEEVACKDYFIYIPILGNEMMVKRLSCYFIQ